MSPRTCWRFAAALLLLCVALAHLQTQPSSSGLQRSYGFAAAAEAMPAAAFDEEDSSFGTPAGDDEEHVAAARTAASAAPATPAARSAVLLDDEDVADLLADQDEFVGAEEVVVAAPKAKKSSGKKKASKKGSKKVSAEAAAAASAAAAQPTVENVIAAPQSFLQPWGINEYIALAGIALYVLNYFLGSQRNRAIANQFSEHFLPIFAQEFAQVGAEDDVQVPALQKESANSFKLYCSGRRFCESALVTLDLVARQDLFAVVGGLVDLATNKDTINIDVPMDEDAMPPLVFGILRRKLAKKIIKADVGGAAADLEAMATAALKNTTATRAGLEKYVVLSELGAEVEAELVGSEKVLRVLSRPSVEAQFVSMHVSDSAAAALPFSRSSKVLRFRFALPSSFASAGEDSPLEATQALVKLAFHFVDRLGELKLSPAARTRSEQKRKKIAEQAHKASHRERQEALQLRKEEQRKKEAEIIAADPHSEVARELLRKKEAKEAKMLKKQKNSGVRMMR